MNQRRIVAETWPRVHVYCSQCQGVHKRVLFRSQMLSSSYKYMDFTSRILQVTVQVYNYSVFISPRYIGCLEFCCCEGKQAYIFCGKQPRRLTTNRRTAAWRCWSVIMRASTSTDKHTFINIIHQFVIYANRTPQLKFRPFRHGGMWNDPFIANFLLSVRVKEF